MITAVIKAKSLLLLSKTFSPDQPRDESGKWSEDGGGAGIAEAEKESVFSTTKAENLNKTLGSQAKELGKKEKEAIESYSDDDTYDKINSALRRGEISSDVAPIIETMDKAFASDTANLSESINVVRGIREMPQWAEEGKIVNYRAYMSTTVSKTIASKFGKVRMEIELPAGSRAIWMDGVNKMSKYPHEQELLLPRGTRLQVVSKSQNRIKLRVLPPKSMKFFSGKRLAEIKSNNPQKIRIDRFISDPSDFEIE